MSEAGNAYSGGIKEPNLLLDCTDIGLLQFRAAASESFV